MRIYSVELLVSGAVTVRRAVEFRTDKELDLGSVFQSDVSIKPHKQGFLISSTVHTADQDRAHKVALLFIGKMLDILVMRVNSPLNVSLNEYRQVTDRNIVRAVIDRAEFTFCFELARNLNLQENKLLRAFSWYRKGLYTDDPFDKFLALWNAISVIADGYCNDNERTRLGVINRIWDCFITLWGPCADWEYVGGNDQWVNDNNEIRNKIAHGGVTIDARYVENVISNLPAVQNVAYKLLTQWATRLGRNVFQQV
ncbi:methylamine utilization protein MauJ [Mucilaginibacter flavus]|uniref:methylamine utilization protein MauJ n=1 Tax=Mucilaginibacter flavus TaxID=931504 RepID=UPI0025B46F08|nr:methylamine utilization protein MauJ [Mucilaginibacter flavus]MDN3582110.1 HEPN domain-containing protein [Mucilaginibacter flavus]